MPLESIDDRIKRWGIRDAEMENERLPESVQCCRTLFSETDDTRDSVVEPSAKRCPGKAPWRVTESRMSSAIQASKMEPIEQ
jgi:hypothetical protein